jgi:hypothetical protein
VSADVPDGELGLPAIPTADGTPLRHPDPAAQERMRAEHVAWNRRQQRDTATRWAVEIVASSVRAEGVLHSAQLADAVISLARRLEEHLAELPLPEGGPF